MRRVVLGAVWLLLTGCAAPLSDGGVWSRQGLQQELAISRLSEQQRAATAHEFELQVADAALDAEQARLQAALQQCPAPRPLRPLDVSPADRLRDTIRVRIGDDNARRQRVAQQALADWRLRVAAAQGAPEWCQRARAALTDPPGPSSGASLSATDSGVTRAFDTGGPTANGETSTMLTEYAL